MKNIYEMLNDIETNTEEYEQQDFAEFEAKKWQQKMKKQVHKSNTGKKVVAAACAAVCLAVPFHNQVAAAMESATEAINNWLTWGTIDKNVALYENVINTSVVDDEIEVKLESVILDDHELLVSTVQKYPKEHGGVITKNLENGIHGSWNVRSGDFEEIREDLKNPENTIRGYPCMAMAVTLDGKEVTGREKIDPTEADEEGIRVIYKLYIDEKEPLELEKEMKMKLEFQEVAGISDGSWEFEFLADGKEISADTLSVPLNQKVKMPHGKEITLTKYKRNELGTYIYYDGPVDMDCYIQLRGVNDRNELVWFWNCGIDEEKIGRFEIYPLNDMRAEDAKELNLSVYWHEKGKENKDIRDADYEQYGETFTIKIPAEDK